MEITPEHRRVLSGEARGAWAVYLRAVLGLLSVPYGAAMAVRNFLYDVGVFRARRVERPVISIGNITTGGTGKTPAVEYVVRWLAGRGVRPVILSRGYKAREGRNDEALLLAAHLPDVLHLQDPNRYRAACDVIAQGRVDVLVLDDGFQHRGLARFADIVLIDATCPFGYGHLLPRGLLREPLRSLRRADLIVVTRCNLAEEGAVERILAALDEAAPSVSKATADVVVSGLAAYPGGEALDAAALRGRRVGLFCSIGNPGAFRRTVESLGAEVGWATVFPDHHWYVERDIEVITGGGHPDTELFVTTQKDAVKLGELWPSGRKLVVLGVEMRMRTGGEELERPLTEAAESLRYGEEADEQEI